MNNRDNLDIFFNNSIKLKQPKGGYKSGTDAILLSSIVPKLYKGNILDIGSGYGLIALILKHKCPDSLITALEKCGKALDTLKSNALLNNLDINIVHRDIVQYKDHGNYYDLVVSNPPFYAKESSQVSSNASKAESNIESTASLQDFITIAIKKCKPIKGQAAFIYPSFRLTEILNCLSELRVSNITIIPVHSKAHRDANRVIVIATKSNGYKNTLTKILPPLYLYQDNSEYTEEAKNILINGHSLRSDIIK